MVDNMLFVYLKGDKELLSIVGSCLGNKRMKYFIMSLNAQIKLE